MGQCGFSGFCGLKGFRGIKGNVGLCGKKGDLGFFGNFVGLNCMLCYSNWVNKIKWFYEYFEVYCDRREFLQGFSFEEINLCGLLRFKYICCVLRLLYIL